MRVASGGGLYGPMMVALPSMTGETTTAPVALPPVPIAPPDGDPPPAPATPGAASGAEPSTIDRPPAPPVATAPPCPPDPVLVPPPPPSPSATPPVPEEGGSVLAPQARTPASRNMPGRSPNAARPQTVPSKSLCFWVI